MSDDIIKRLREAIAAPALHDEGASSDDTWQAVRKFRQLASPDNIAALLDRLDAAERVLELTREDARRYRWLRGDACPDHSVRWTQWEVRCWVAPFWSDDLRREGLDRSIDAAVAAEQSERRGK